MIFCFILGSRLKCVACRIIVHEGCIPLLNSYFICRQSYRESVRKYREQTSIEHHWVQRRNLKVKLTIHENSNYNEEFGEGLLFSN